MSYASSIVDHIETLAQLSPSMALPPSLLHSASVPSEEERTSVKQRIQQTKAKLSTIDQEIARLRTAIAELESYRGEVQDELETSEAVLAPIRHLPAEILTEIFLYAASNSTMTWPRASTSRTGGVGGMGVDEIPWCIGEVCSYWRTLLLSLPEIWSTIRLDLSSKHPPLSSPTANLTTGIHQFLDLCITRSGNSMLNIVLKYSTDGRNPGEDPARELACSALMTLVGVSERWQDVTLDLEDLFSFHALLTPARDRVPNLRRLYLASSGHSLTTPRRWNAIDAFLNAPLLDNLTLVQISQPTLHLRLPWSQLKYLRSSGSHYHEGEFTALLKQAHSLEEFRTEDERVLDMAVTLPPPLPLLQPTLTTSSAAQPSNSAVYLPHLRTLSITNKGSYISRITQLLTAPSLTDLTIRSRTSYNAEPTIAMLRRSNCSLQLRNLNLESSRDLEVVWEENYGIVCLLAETKGVEVCSLRVSKSADEIIPRLTVRRGMGGNPQRSPVLSTLGPAGYGGYASGYTASSSKVSGQGAVLLPNLRVFSIEDSFCESAGELKEMVESRMVATGRNAGGQEETAQIKEVCLRLSRPAPPTYAELNTLQETAKGKGISIDVFV